MSIEFYVIMALYPFWMFGVFLLLLMTTHQWREQSFLHGRWLWPWKLDD